MPIKRFDTPQQYAASRDHIELSDDMVQAIHDSVSDPSGLQPFMREQIKQADERYKQLEDVNQKLQTQIDDARQTAIIATRDAKIARIISLLSLAVAILAIIVPFFRY
ncbi:MAG: hypothetical protein ACLUDG_08205 [Butyricicoccus sp.]